VRRLHNRLIAAFVVATVAPLAAAIWIATSLLDQSLAYATTGELDRLSGTLERTVRQFYQRERDALRRDALSGRIGFMRYTAGGTAWPEAVRAFWESTEHERFGVSGPNGDHVDYMRRSGDGVDVYRRDLGGIRMQELSAALSNTRSVVSARNERDLKRGFTLTLYLLVGLVWLASLAPLVFIARRISHPIQELTAGLTSFAAGDWNTRLDTGNRDDEVGRAVGAFNHMAAQLREQRERLIYLARMSSWQSIARKTAHELKNSLTPIRLTVEEMLARHPPTDRAFMEQASQIVVSEIDTLERRVRAFSELASEPALHPARLDINALLAERVTLLERVHPGTTFRLRLDESTPRVIAPADLLKGILTNLLQNAAEAAATGGQVLAATRRQGSLVQLEVHDSGPGLTADVAGSLFEPTISFKRGGMGLGLSIVKRNAVLSGGDVDLIAGELGGAAFRVTLPAAGDAAGTLRA
jgi:nitrogen fixation/metabolism regulation signal transduction histidine kinase